MRIFRILPACGYKPANGNEGKSHLAQNPPKGYVLRPLGRQQKHSPPAERKRNWNHFMEIIWTKVENIDTGITKETVAWKKEYDGHIYGDYINQKDLIGDAKDWGKKAFESARKKVEERKKERLK